MIIIDIDMPDNCDECRFNTEYGFCKAKPDNFCGNTDNWKRPEWCPLKEQKAKKGHWIVLESCADEGIYCSECHKKIFDRTTKPKKKLSQYCPHCGSKNDQFFRDGEVVFR